MIWLLINNKYIFYIYNIIKKYTKKFQIKKINY